MVELLRSARRPKPLPDRLEAPPMLNRRLPLLAVSLFSLVGLQASGLMASPATPGFHAAVQMPSSTGGTEPSLAISNDGIRYVSWQSPGKFAGSADGVTFNALATPDAGAAGDVTNAVSYSGALYNGQICGGATELHSCIYRSLDGGNTWTPQNILADNHPGASDRPWIDVYPKNNSTATASNPNKGVGFGLDRRRYHVVIPPRLAGRVQYDDEDRRQRRQDLLHHRGGLGPPGAHRVVGAAQRRPAGVRDAVSGEPGRLRRDPAGDRSVPRDLAGPGAALDAAVPDQRNHWLVLLPMALRRSGRDR